MKKGFRVALAFVGGVAASHLLFTARAAAVPSYTREYGVSCTTCHSMWGSLTPAGATFRLSGYRAINGRDLTPAEKPIALANGALTFPGTFPASIITGAGLDYRREDRQAAAATGSIVQTGANITVMDASIFLTGPLGKHLSFFMEFPMFESKAWEFTPTGPAEANDRTATGKLQLASESPAFEVAKFWWNSVLGDAAPRDSVNLLGGITHLPLAYPSGKVRLSVNQYLVYERRALDYISGSKVGTLLGDADEHYFRLGEPTGMFEVNGMLTPGKAVTDVSKRETFWLEYHLGVANASNPVSDNNTSKAVYGRYVMRWYNQSLGAFALWTDDVYDNGLRSTAEIGGPSGVGIMSGLQKKNSTVRAGPDATLSLAPFDIPVSLENNVLYNRESDPTGFGKEFVWWGGFHQLNWTVVPKKAITYARYDWIKGKEFDDTGVTANGHIGATKAHPSEWDVVAGLQYLVLENFKLIGEYRHHRFEDKAGGPRVATLTDDGFTLRAMAGF